METSRFPHFLRAAFAFAAVISSLAVCAQGQIEKVIYNFPSFVDGDNPEAKLTLSAPGHLFGTAAQGGNSSGLCSNQGCGVVFALSNSGGTWSKRVLYRFQGLDGSTPRGGMIFDAAGNLYGTTEFGGNGPCNYGGSPGCGVVFKLTRGSGGNWHETVLHTFTGSDGANPLAGLTFDSAGNLYGATQNGGDTVGCGGGTGCGVVFELSPSSSGWTETVLHTFVNDGSDGLVSGAPVTFDTAGNLYGSTLFGGSHGFGTVFQLSPSTGWSETILHNFTGNQDGWSPTGELVLDGSGNIFGVTQLGGTSPCLCGVVFELSPNTNGGWSERVLATELGWNGNVPVGIAADAGGSLDFVAFAGGNNASCAVGEGCGAVVRLSPTSTGGWQQQVLHRFAGFPDGEEPLAGVTVDASGRIFGVAASGKGTGLVYEITP